ncbi:DUF5683 domain-containing protein [Chitinophaga sp. NPDC101104]|uniref:DUF5683 domain-containing protein n=1 Tax=Chitinophaga sp. NPDC101104 TaxID=3390561 RepID=UPI003D041122
MKNSARFLLCCLLLLPFSGLLAQTDTANGNRVLMDSLKRRPTTTEVGVDTVYASPADSIVANYKPLHSPRKAAFYSAVLPGLGQIYNRQYWKVPIVYAAIGVSTGVFLFNMDKYREFRGALRARVANRDNPDWADPYKRYPDGDLSYLRDAYRQYVDYSVLVFVAAYALNIVDATVFAHLRQFDISNDLSIRVSPKMFDKRTIGVGLTITLNPQRQRSGGFSFK